MRLPAMLSRMYAATVLSAAVIHLSGCDRPAKTHDPAPTSAASPGVTAAAPAEAVKPAAKATPTATPPSESRDPKVVLLAWAKAMSLNDWGSAYLYWGDKGAASGLTLPQFQSKWDKLKYPQFDIYPGQQEGAAGSSFFTAPLVLIDGKRRVKGEIVLRRVNDVDGATPEQLRWHIEKMTIEP